MIYSLLGGDLGPSSLILVLQLQHEILITHPSFIFLDNSILGAEDGDADSVIICIDWFSGRIFTKPSNIIIRLFCMQDPYKSAPKVGK